MIYNHRIFGRDIVIITHQRCSRLWRPSHVLSSTVNLCWSHGRRCSEELVSLCLFTWTKLKIDVKPEDLPQKKPHRGVWTETALFCSDQHPKSVSEQSAHCALFPWVNPACQHSLLCLRAARCGGRLPPLCPPRKEKHVYKEPLHFHERASEISDICIVYKGPFCAYKTNFRLPWRLHVCVCVCVCCPDVMLVLLGTLYYYTILPVTHLSRFQDWIYQEP